jgi:YggT family protein
MAAIIYIVGTLFSLYIGVLLLRFVMQLVRADFRNQAAQAIVALTNPVIMPLRRLLPPVGKVDTASVIAILLLSAAKVVVLSSLSNARMPTPIGWLYLLTVEIVISVLWVFFFCVVLRALIGFLTQGAYTPVAHLLESITEPLLRPIRRYIPSFVGGFDLSYLWATIAIQALIILIGTSIVPRL